VNAGADRGGKVLDPNQSPPVWQAAACQLSAAKGFTLADDARLFPLLTMGVANTCINDWDAKFTDNFEA
jgi:hypothetical protein